MSVAAGKRQCRPRPLVGRHRSSLGRVHGRAEHATQRRQLDVWREMLVVDGSRTLSTGRRQVVARLTAFVYV